MHKTDAPKPQSSIITPSMESIKLFDPKVKKEMDAARMDLQLNKLIVPASSGSPLFIWLLWAIIIFSVAIAMYYL